MEKRIDCSDLVGTYNLEEAKALVVTIQNRITQVMREEVLEEDNDFKSMGKHKALKRHISISRLYESGLLDKLRAKGYHIEELDEGTRIVILKENGNKMTYYPKSDKMLHHSINSWVKHAFSQLNKLV